MPADRLPSRIAALLGLLGLAAGGLAGCATTSEDKRVASAVDLGQGEKGELCRAERVWHDPAAPEMFDRVYNLRCRGWTDTQSAGHLYAIDARTSGAMTAINAARDARMACGDPSPVTVAGLGAAMARRCVEREAGFPAFSITAVVGKTLYEVEALDRFNANAYAGLTLLSGRGQLPSPSAIPSGKIELGAAKPPSGTIKAFDAVDEMALATRRGEIIEYSVRGQNVEAREVVTRYSARLASSATPADRVSFLLESALSESNLGYQEVAADDLGRAKAILERPDAPTGAGGDLLRAKLHVYAGLLALNRRDFAIAIAEGEIGAQVAGALAGASIAEPGSYVASQGDPLRDPATIRDLNAQGADQSLRSAIVRPGQLVAQAHWVRASAFRALGQPDQALAELAIATATLDRVERVGGSQSSGLEWLRSQIAVQHAQIAEQQGKVEEARVFFAESVTRLELARGYAGSPLLAQRKLSFAAFLASHSARGEAMKQYASALAVMVAGGPSAAAAGSQLEGYFALLEEDAKGSDPAVALAARQQFFIASQLVNPPAVAAQIAQIQKIFESGSSEAAVRAKSLQDLDREGRTLANQIAALPPESKDRATLQGQLDEIAARTLDVRRELAGDQQYLQVNDSPVTLADFQAVIKPGEAYAKILTLPHRSYMIVATHDDAAIYPVGMGTVKLTALVGRVRKSIDGNVAADGHVVPLVFDVDASADLYDALLAPAAPLLANVRSLITEPSGAMTQLPFSVLVGDRQSVAWFDENVKKNSRDYSKVGFLASRYDLDTTVSPRSFLVARAQNASRAAKPYIGFGDHAHPDAAALQALPSRGALAGRCSINADALRDAFGSLASIGEKELATAQTLSGPGSVVVEAAAFSDTALDAHRDYSQYAVVHFATHGLKEGELDCDNPPALITSIADDPQSDGLLSFEEIANLQFDANLVVLSACNTAAETNGRAGGAAGFTAGAAGQGATLNGLVRAFLVAGSRAVLTTHWAIPDSFKTRDGRQVAASTQLIETFFKTGKTDSIATALRAAQTGMINQIDTSHPYYWAAFAIVGDGDKHMFARAS